MTYSLEGCCARSFQFNSIHAPARGATSAPPPPPHGGLRFNSRTREGYDGETSLTIGLPLIVSIHAPARGATSRHSLHTLP